jgi:manganese transport protein
MFTSDRKKMDGFVNSRFLTASAWAIAAIIIALNGYLLVQTFAEWL